MWTKNNKINFISDFKYLNYPSEIYGLGGKKVTVDANANTPYTVNFQSVKLHQSIMFSIGRNPYTGGGIFYDQFWNIKISNTLG